MKRKRKVRESAEPRKRAKSQHNAPDTQECRLLRLYYPRVQSLYEYLSSRSPTAGRRLRRCLLRSRNNSDGTSSTGDAQEGLARLLETVKVGSFENASTTKTDERHDKHDKALELFSQQVLTSTAVTVSSQGSLSQSEVSTVSQSVQDHRLTKEDC